MGGALGSLELLLLLQYLSNERRESHGVEALKSKSGLGT